MAFPTKTSREEILRTATEIVERDGIEALSMREIAKRLELAPNALYHHFKNRGELESEIAAEGFRQILKSVKQTVGNITGSEAVIKSSHAYLEFARAHPEIYKMMFKKHELTSGLHDAIVALQRSSKSIYSWLSSDQRSEEAQSAIFAMLHGIVALEREGISESDFKVDPTGAISALLAGLEQAG